MATATDATEHVLEFRIGGERYCVSIDYVTEIVDVGDLTSVPNSPDYIEGVMDLRGRTTTIVDPKAVFEIESAVDARRIIVFDPTVLGNRAAAGWLVDEVDQVIQVDSRDIDAAPAEDEDAIHGVLKGENGDFTIFVDPVEIHSN